jgi:hypothetical protein
MTDFNIPGIINTGSSKNSRARIVADPDGSFAVKIGPLFPVNHTAPLMEAMISLSNHHNHERILWDKVGLLAEPERVGDGMVQYYWRNRATGPHGFLLRRGTYCFRAKVNGIYDQPKYIVSQSSPQREDWEDYRWINRCALVAESSELEG